MDHQWFHLIGEPLFQQVHAARTVLIENVPVAGNLDRFAVDHMEVLVVLHKIGEIESDGNDLHIGHIAHLLLCFQCDPEDTFSEVPEPALVGMVPFGHDTELVLAVEHIDGDIEDFLVLTQLLHPVADAEHREDLQGVQRLCHQLFPEKVGPCQEDRIARR